VAGLIWTLVRTDFKTRYHGTLGGFAWALLKPFTMFLVLTMVFSFVFASSDRNYALNLILGIFLWEFFAETTKVGLQALASKGYLLTKARFRSWILIVTSAANPVITLSVFSIVLTAFLAISGRSVSAVGLALYMWYLLHYLVMVVGISLAGSVLLLRYRDLDQVWDVVTQAGFFLAPIIWPINVLPERLHFYFFLWPPTAIIQFSRAVLVDTTAPTLKAHVLLSLEAAVIFAMGTLVFRRYAPRAAEYL
jgi:lipopolysaccharide transport system permease protein